MNWTEEQLRARANCLTCRREATGRGVKRGGGEDKRRAAGTSTRRWRRRRTEEAESRWSRWRLHDRASTNRAEELLKVCEAFAEKEEGDRTTSSASAAAVKLEYKVTGKHV